MPPQFPCSFLPSLHAAGLCCSLAAGSTSFLIRKAHTVADSLPGLTNLVEMRSFSVPAHHCVRGEMDRDDLCVGLTPISGWITVSKEGGTITKPGSGAHLYSWETTSGTRGGRETEHQESVVTPGLYTCLIWSSFPAWLLCVHTRCLQLT